jgi:hypothetical protein
MANNSSSTKHVFTLHHWTETDWKYLPILCESNENIIYLKVAQENGKEGDTQHLQGVVVFVNKYKQRASKVSKILMGPNKNTALPDPKNPGSFLKHHYHVETMKGTYQEAADYCGNLAKEGSVPIYEYGEIPSKAPQGQGKRTDYDYARDLIKEKAIAGWKLAAIEELIPKFECDKPGWVRKIYNRYRKFGTNFFENNEMFKWQKELVSYLNDHAPDPRRILFVVDEEGNAGKSEIAKNARYLFPNKSVFSVPPQDYRSMASLIPDDGVDIIIIDCPREDQYDLPYKLFEGIKTGSVVQTKYEPVIKEFPSPHLVVMMNRNPKTGKTILSTDRYTIIEIELEPEERARLTTKQTVATAPYIAKHLKRTREILDACEEEKAKKRARMEENFDDDIDRPYRPHKSL